MYSGPLYKFELDTFVIPEKFFDPFRSQKMQEAGNAPMPRALLSPLGSPQTTPGAFTWVDPDLQTWPYYSDLLWHARRTIRYVENKQDDAMLPN